MKKITLFGVTAAMLLSSATGAFAAVETFQPNAEGLFTVTADVAGVQKDAMYGVLAVAGDVLSETIDEEDITYIDQITATEAGKFSLANFGLKADAPNSTLYIGGAGLDGATEVAKLAVKVEVKGNTITGSFASLNAANGLTVELWKAGESGDVKVDIAPVMGEATGTASNVTQTFTFSNVEAGTYKIVATKASHIKFVVTDVVVSGSDVAMNEYTMLCGDLNNDGSINPSDANVIFEEVNYYKGVADAENKFADLNNDGSVNPSDANVIFEEANYYKGEADCVVKYAPAE